MEYRATLDKPAKIITIVCFLLFGFVIYTNSALSRVPVWASALFTLVLFASFIGGFLYAPSKYLVKNGSLVIVRPINRIVIPLSDIREARIVSSDELGTLIRLWGSGGLFGYYGYFRSTRMGRMTLYTTRINNRILVTTVDDERLLISPDDTSILDHLKV